jgi:hypothetical protein
MNPESANQITSLDAAMTILLHIEDHWRGASEFACWGAQI